MINKLNNLRQIKVSFLGATNNKGSRIKIYEPRRYNSDKIESKIYSYCYKIGDIQNQAYNILTNNGFNIICTASEFNNYIFLCDNWGGEFIKITNLK